MTISNRDNIAETAPSPSLEPDVNEAPASWTALQSDESIQFAPVRLPELGPREPTWLDRVFEFLAELLGPVGGFIASSWPVLKWVLLATAAALVLTLVVRIVQARTLRMSRDTDQSNESDQWVPTEAESAALLSDADSLAAQGRFDEATHLLLIRSVKQIAAKRPDWVVPSSTARELMALPSLSEPARKAFRTIAERVERSMFALRELDRSDWETARAAYADFALARIERKQGPA